MRGSFAAGRRWLIGFCAALFSSAAPAQPSDAAGAEFRSAVEAVNKAALPGPADIALLDQALLKLPKGLGYVPAAQTRRLVAAMGNRTGEGLLGMVLSSASGADGLFIVLRFARSGYVKDDEAKHWKPDELLADLRKGMEQTAKKHRSRGIGETEAAGWIEAPKYDAAAHHLVWLIESKEKGGPDDVWGDVQYNIVALGRDGYISMNFVAKIEQLEAGKTIVRALLAALQYNGGKRYGDFNPATDPVAEHGLAALVSGVALQKPGFFGQILAFLLEFAKIIGVAILVIVAAGLTIYKIRKETADAS